VENGLRVLSSGSRWVSGSRPLRQQYYFCLAVIVPSCHAQAPERPAPAPGVEFNFEVAIASHFGTPE